MPHILQEHCANLNLITQAVTEQKSWSIKPATMSLSMGTDGNGQVLGRIDTSDAYIYLLQNTSHQVRLWLEETLVVGNTELFNLLVGNKQLKLIGECITQNPTAQLHPTSQLAGLKWVPHHYPYE